MHLVSGAVSTSQWLPACAILAPSHDKRDRQPSHFVRAVFIDQLFSTFSFFFLQEKTGKAGKTANFFKVWKFNRGENIGKASHYNIWGKKRKLWKHKKLREKKNRNLDKKSFDKGRSYQAFFSQFFLFFFQEKQQKMEKQETFPKFGDFTEGKIFGRLRIPIFGKKIGK